MNTTASKCPSITNAICALETGLAVARILYTNYFEQTGEGAGHSLQRDRVDVGAAFGAVIDCIQSAQETLEAIENQTA